MIEKTPESPLDCKEIKPVNPKGNQSWILIGRSDAEAEAPIFRPPNGKSQLTGKDPDAGTDWRKKEKGVAYDEMVGWHHWLDGHEFKQTPGNSEGQGTLLCCSPWVAKSQTGLATEQQHEEKIHMETKIVNKVFLQMSNLSSNREIQNMSCTSLAKCLKSLKTSSHLLETEVESNYQHLIKLKTHRLLAAIAFLWL